MENKTKVIMGIVITVIIIGIVVLIASITTVPTGYVGVKTRFGQVQDDVIQEGFNLKAPFIESIVKIDCRTQKYEIATEASSKDLQKISNLKVVVNYNVDKNNANNLYKEVGKDYQTVLIEPAILESIKQGISQYTAEETITKRSEVADVIINLLKEKLENKGVTVTALNITDLSFSEEFDTAVEQKQIVEQETQKAQYELEKAKVENEKKIENAKADTEVMRQQNEQITDNYLRLKEIENEQKAIEKWNGQLPTTTSNAIPFINVN
jgi:regulator of protease activity HflC (stomatin/prohibitin superfamily)